MDTNFIWSVYLYINQLDYKVNVYMLTLSISKEYLYFIKLYCNVLVQETGLPLNINNIIHRRNKYFSYSKDS